jgi:alpha 1,2-mannosyltransferase
MLPPNVRRLFTSSPLVGVTVLILLCLALFFHRPIQELVAPFRPWSTSSSPSSSHAPAVALEPLPTIPLIYEEYFPDGTLPSSLTTPEHHLLAERLIAFLSRPRESYDEATERMHENCPAEVSDKLVNPDQYNGDSGFWMNDVTKEEIVKRRADVVRWLEERVEQGEKIIGSERTGKGRGIVLTGGNQVRSGRAPLQGIPQ